MGEVVSDLIVSGATVLAHTAADHRQTGQEVRSKKRPGESRREGFEEGQ